jgi:DNA-directed RNA polymerase subunit M/transcription elongation factor TFIIS
MGANEIISCKNYKCGYEGLLEGKDGKGAEYTDPMTGKTINLAKVKTFADVEFDPSDGSRWKNGKQISPATHTKRIVRDDFDIGILFEDNYICPKCDCKKIFVLMMQSRYDVDKPEIKMCTCSYCGYKFRGYQ